MKSKTTYQVGLLQARASRILKHHTASILAEHEVSTVEWAFLGLLFENKKGIRLSLAADELGVEAPFITSLITKLLKKELIEYQTDLKDNRAKLIALTNKGETFVTDTEKVVKQETKPLLKDISATDFTAYLNVLKKIIQNCKELEDTKKK